MMIAMMTKSAMKGNDNHRSTFTMAACPMNGSSACKATAPMTSAIFSPLPALTPALAARAIPASTMSAMPSISKPTWVIQLNREGTRFPFGPNGARLTAKAVVPATGPCKLANPVKR